MKITKRQLKRIIKEEKARLLRELTPADMGIAAAKMDDQRRAKFTLSPESKEWAAAYDQLYDELRNAFAVAMEAGLLEDDISEAIDDAREYLRSMA